MLQLKNNSAIIISINTTQMTQLEKLIKTLKSKGKRITENKEAILRIFISTDKPIGIPEILNKLSYKNLSPNKTTVYREIYNLEKLNIIKKIFIDQENKLYELNSADNHHHHIVCTICNKVAEFEPPVEIEESIKKFQKSLSKNSKFQIKDHSFEFFGICNNCNNK